MKNRLKGVGSLFLATSLYAFFGVFTKLIGYKLPLFFQSWSRNLFALIILLVIILYFRGWKKVKRHDWKWFIVRSTVGMISYITSFISFHALTIGTALFVFYAGSIVGGFIIGKIFYNEHLNKVKVISVIFSIIGLYLIYSINVEVGMGLYLVMAIFSGIASAIWNTFSKKISGSYSNLQLNTLDYAISTGILFSISLLLRESWVMPSFNSTWIYSGLFTLFMLPTGFLVVYGFKRLDAQIGSIVMLFEVVGGIILGYLFFHEIISVTTLIGGVLILSAIIMPLTLKFHKKIRG